MFIINYRLHADRWFFFRYLYLFINRLFYYLYYFIWLKTEDIKFIIYYIILYTDLLAFLLFEIYLGEGLV